jgi:hypothetical protein
MVSSLWVSPSEGAHIDALMPNDSETEEPFTDEVYIVAVALSKRAEEGDFKMSIGSTYASGLTFLTVASDDEWDENQSEEADMEDDIDCVMASITGSFPSGVSPEHLSKVWRISHEDAKRTLANTSQLSRRPTCPELSTNYGTKDRILRYKRIKDYFYMDTFFATKKWKVFQGSYLLPIVSDRQGICLSCSYQEEM